MRIFERTWCLSQAGAYTAGSGGGMPIEFITGNSGGPVGPDGANNINTVGTGNITIAGNPGTNTLTTELTGITQHSIQVGGATNTLTQLGVATNGQLPIGSTGADPVLATLTAGTGITVTNGAGSISIASDGTQTLNYTNVNTTPYVVLSTDQYLSVDCSGGVITVQLPNAATLGRVYTIKDRTGSAAAFNITVTTVGGAVNIDGATTFVMNTAYESINVIGNGSTYEVY